MGTWGPAIFSDDLAADVRAEWRQLVSQGLAGPDATRQVIAGHSDSIADLHERGVFWIALALTQHRAGRAEAAVVAAALGCISSGDDLERWRDDDRTLNKRANALSKARDELLRPMRPPTRIVPRYVANCEWPVHEVIVYQLSSGGWIPFRVLRFHTDLGGTYPVVEFLDLVVETPPRLEDCRGRSIRSSTGFVHTIKSLMICAGSVKERPEARLLRLGQLSTESRDGPRQEGPVITAWCRLDALLAEHFGFPLASDHA